MLARESSSLDVGEERPKLVEVAERAGARTPRIAAGSACAPGSRCARRAFGRHRENTQLRAQLLALTLRALGLVTAEDQGLKLVLAFLTDVFENRHDDRSRASVCSY